jgi:ABC-type cobalamin/Fe3+-siderophores transport system ATPase subunit
VHRLHREDGLTVLLVSHLLEDVANYVSRLAIVERDFFKVGKVDEILTGQNLSTMYEVPVDVRTIDGRKVILSGGGNGGR